MAPGAAQAVVNGLRAGTAGRAGQGRTLAAGLEVDAALGGVELHVLESPWQLQTPCAGEQRFNADAHRFPWLEDRPVGIVNVSFHTKRRGAVAQHSGSWPEAVQELRQRHTLLELDATAGHVSFFRSEEARSYDHKLMV